MKSSLLSSAAFACSITAFASQPPIGPFLPSPLQAGVYASAPEVVATHLAGKSGGAPAIAVALSPDVTAIAGFKDPSAIVRRGNSFFVSNNEDNATKTISVIDATVPFGEVITQTFSTPVDPVDCAFQGNEIFLADQKRSPLYWKDLSSNTWNSIALPVAIDEWTYGNITFAHPTQNRMFVVQFWENRIHVVDTQTKSLVTTITNLHHLPTSIAFSADGSKMAVLCTGLSAPSCGASGPNLAVFDSTSFSKLYEVDLQGTCSRALTTDGQFVFVVRDSDVRKYDFATGALVTTMSIGGLGRNANFNGTDLVVQDLASGAVKVIDPGLTQVLATYGVVSGPSVWLPPTEEMATFDNGDGRVFVTVRNDDAVSVVHHSPDCVSYGTGCAGSGGFVPKLGKVGCPTAGANFALNLTRGLGGASMLMFIGLSQTSIPLGAGCTFLVAPVNAPLFSAPLTGSGPGTGGLALSIPVPSSVPAGITVTLQAVVIDPGAFLGFSMTNGLSLVTH